MNDFYTHFIDCTAKTHLVRKIDENITPSTEPNHPDESLDADITTEEIKKTAFKQQHN